MKYAHVDEWYTWLPLGQLDEANRHCIKSFPDHYAKIPDKLYKRLEKACDELSKVGKEVEKFKGRAK